MKNIKFTIIALIFVTGLSSCLDEWLTVNPKTDITESMMFNNEEGFKDALTGAYIRMNHSNAYGQALTFTTLEYFTSSWDVVSKSTQQKMGLFNYQDNEVESQLELVFSKEYQIIADVNSILDRIDTNKDAFKTPGMYELVKGECLAIRAYCHFDILRMFGPVPSLAGSGSILPYVKTVSQTPTSLISFSEFQKAIIEDLSEAEKLLKTVDPIMNFSLLELGTPGNQGSSFKPADKHFGFRYFRMNYYAVKALQARAFLWFDMKPEAYQSALEVINATNTDGSKKFRLGTLADLTASNYLFTNEQVFALYDYKLYSKYTSLFQYGVLKKGSSETLVKSQLYGNTGTDIREANHWELITQGNQAKTYVLRKYKVDETTSSHQTDYKRIPMIRLAELYLIAVESGPLAEAQVLWDDFRTSRNIQTTQLSEEKNTFTLDLMKEYRKEFIGEGQTFFAYKRHNIQRPNFLWLPSAVSTVDYVFPLPKTELTTTN